MAKTESTAVNELIDLVQSNKPLPMGDPGGELFAAPAPQKRASSPSLRAASGTMHPPRMTSTIPPMRVAGEVAPLPRARAPQSTAEHAMPQFSDPRVRIGTASPSRGTTIPPLPPRSTPAGTLPPPTAPIAAPFEVKPADSLVARLSSASLPLPKQELLFDPDATMLGTLEDTQRADRIALAKKLVIPAIACIAAGIGLGFYVSANKAKPATPSTAQVAPAPTAGAPTPSAPPTETVRHPAPRSIESANAATASAGGEQPQPPTREEQAADMAAAAAGGSLTSDAPADKLRDVQTPAPRHGAIALTDVRIDTDPQGASILLIDRGKKFPLGSSPLSTSLDPSRTYEVIIELAGRPAQTIQLDPATTSRLDIALGKKQRAAAPSLSAVVAKAEKAAIQAPDDLASEKPAAPSKAERADKPTAPKQPEKTNQAAVTEVGMLMVSSKPPCEIHIDGAPTGLTTPQRGIELAPGKHKITFINADANIKKTFSVTIKAGEPTKLIQDFLAP